MSADGKTVAATWPSRSKLPPISVLGAPGTERPVTPSVPPNTGLDVSVQDVRAGIAITGRIQGLVAVTHASCHASSKTIVDAHGGRLVRVTSSSIGSQGPLATVRSETCRVPGTPLALPNSRGVPGEGESYPGECQ